MQEILNTYQDEYGDIHPKTLDASEKLCEYLNLSAMKLLEQEKYDMSLEYLRRAESLASTSNQSRATTFNNLACLYRRTGKLRAALSYLFQALTL
jgi:tetratricopeptide (TPR) repeat protein